MDSPFCVILFLFVLFMPSCCPRCCTSNGGLPYWFSLSWDVGYLLSLPLISRHFVGDVLHEVRTCQFILGEEKIQLLCVVLSGRVSMTSCPGLTDRRKLSTRLGAWGEKKETP